MQASQRASPSQAAHAGGGGHGSQEGEGWDDDEGFDALEDDPHEAEAAERLRRLNMRSGGGAAARTGSVASGSGRGGASGGLARQGSLDSDTSLASGFSHTSSHLTSGGPAPGAAHSLRLTAMQMLVLMRLCAHPCKKHVCGGRLQVRKCTNLPAVLHQLFADCGVQHDFCGKPSMVTAANMLAGLARGLSTWYAGSAVDLSAMAPAEQARKAHVSLSSGARGRGRSGLRSARGGSGAGGRGGAMKLGATKAGASKLGNPEEFFDF